MAVSAYIKDPNAVRDFSVTWLLDEGDTITASTWVAAASNPDLVIAIGANSFINTPAPQTLVRLSGGTFGKEYLVINHITTAQGHQEDHTLIVLCVEE